MELKQKLSQLRKEKGLTQLDLAEALNVSRQAVSRWEVGSAVPSLDNLICLSELYDVSMDYLVHDELDSPKAGEFIRKESVWQTRSALLCAALLALCAIAAWVAIGVTLSARLKNENAGALDVPDSMVVVGSLPTGVPIYGYSEDGDGALTFGHLETVDSSTSSERK